METLGDRMKQYELCYDVRATKRSPMIVRVDGRKFSKLVKKLNVERPFDKTFNKLMADVARKMAPEISGCVLAYTQSDEISFVIRTDTSLNFEPFFGNRIQKICSITSSMATLFFVKGLTEVFPEVEVFPTFDSRVFVLPSINEIINYLIWRQQDATRNSILNATYFELAKLSGFGKKTARKMMHGLNTNKLQSLLFEKAGINWNDYDESFKRGSAVYKILDLTTEGNITTGRRRWAVDGCKIFSSEDGRNWLNRVVGFLTESNTGWKLNG